MPDDQPTFTREGVAWGHTILIQSLIAQLIDSGVLTVENAERVFDIALQRAAKERLRCPDAERFVQHVHDNLRWDDFYRWEAEKRKGQ